jgi:signal transduction histidine kinase
MSDDASDLRVFGACLVTEREAILSDWRQRVRDDPQLVTGNTLPVAKLNDHLTAILENFERRLLALDAEERKASEAAQIGDAAAHGLHRWQQGYDFAELARELGRLNESVVRGIDRCAAANAIVDQTLLARIHAIWATVFGIAVSSSADQFAQLRQIESVGQVRDMEAALAKVRDLEAQRASLWEQAAHDLRGNVAVVAMATAGLTRARASEANRERFLVSLDQNVQSLTALLRDVTTLARLQGGQENRNVADFDVPIVLRDLVDSTQELARERGLLLSAGGPEALLVAGDKTKVRRIVQNLLLNALRYTRQGSVRVGWGDDPESPRLRWYVEVRDTGPGLPEAGARPVSAAIHTASEQSKRVAQAEAAGDVAHVPIADVPASEPQRDAPVSPAGEGIGLSIVKRLCTLLDATMEIESRRGQGTAFRVIFPKCYSV